MSGTSVNIFVSSQEPMSTLAREVEVILHSPLEFREIQPFNERVPKYWAYVFGDCERHIQFKITRHKFTDDIGDDDMPLHKYPYRIEIWAYMRVKFSDDTPIYAFGDSLFDALKATGKYPLLKTENLQVVLDRFNPPT
jgi:hypothetical protein